MLTNIKIKNAYSIKELDMSFFKGRYAYKKDMVYKDIVNPAAIYGYNGAGKSSVINTINDLVNLLIADEEKFYPLIANFNFKNEDTELELTFNLDDVVYVYSLTCSFSKSRIEKEYLLSNNVPLFTRNDSRIIVEDKEYEVKGELYLGIRQLYSLLDELKGAKKEIKYVYNYLTNFTIIKGDEYNSKLCNFKKMEDLMVENSEEIKRVISGFKNMPLFDFLNVKEECDLNIYMKNHKLKLPSFLISDGMLTLNKILVLLINMEHDSVLFVDGIEKNLHPSSVLMLIKEAQKRNIQLIFTSHNTNLMQEFRPDQIYFARWQDGVSYYFRLSSIYDNIREINNIEKMYLSNTFDEAINQIINIDK